MGTLKINTYIFRHHKIQLRFAAYYESKGVDYAERGRGARVIKTPSSLSSPPRTNLRFLMGTRKINTMAPNNKLEFVILLSSGLHIKQPIPGPSSDFDSRQGWFLLVGPKEGPACVILTGERIPNATGKQILTTRYRPEPTKALSLYNRILAQALLSRPPM
jgi:hypothetical protein